MAAVLYSLLLGLIRRFAGGVFGNGGGVGRDEGDDRDRSRDRFLRPSLISGQMWERSTKSIQGGPTKFYTGN